MRRSSLQIRRSSARGPAQRGVAVITAVVLVALASIAAAALISKLHLTLRYLENSLDHDQAARFARGVESASIAVLRADAEGDQVDHFGEQWATPLPPVSIGKGTASGSIVDLQSRFNLNALVQNGAPNAVYLEIFRRLLRGLKLDPAIADAVVDWIDADQEPTLPFGAEDGFYLGLERPYRAADRRFTSASELRLLKGVDAGVYAALAPYVTALPEPTPINVNTAPAAVLQALVEGLSAADARRLVEVRTEHEFESVAAFLHDPTIAARAVEPTAISIGSSYFAVHAAAALDHGSAKRVSVVHRLSDRDLRVIMRYRADLQ